MKNRRICFTGIGQVATLESEFELPEQLSREQLLLQTEYTLISPGTEIDALLGKTDYKQYPQCLGYSAVASVLQTGAETTEFQAGDRVLVYHSCHSQFLLKHQSDCVKIPEKLASEEAIFAVVGAMGFQGVRKIRPKQDSYPSCWTMPDDMRILLELIAAGRINTRELISDIVPPEHAAKIYQRFLDHDPGILGVLFDWRRLI